MRGRMLGASARYRGGLSLYGGGLCAAALLCAALLLWDPAVGAEGVRMGLSLCAGALIPALFPFLCITPFLSYVTARAVGARTLGRWGRLLSVFLIGMVAGFPVGAIGAARQYRAGLLEKEEAECCLGLCVGASPAFLVGYFGNALWGDVRLGWWLYAAQVLLCGAAMAVVCMHGKVRGEAWGSGDALTTPPRIAVCIADAAEAMLGICASAVFFTVLRGYLHGLLPPLGALLLGGAAELLGGICECRAALDTGLLGSGAAVCLSAFMIGLGGASVMMQCAAAAEEAGLSMRRYVQMRILLALGLAGAAAVFCWIWGR